MKNSESIWTFIRKYRKEIDAIITKECPNVGRLNDDNRRGWILNHEPLYLWAFREGVRI